MRRAAHVGFLCAVLSAFGTLRQAPGASPSFDCGRASSPAEKLICASDALAAQDAELSGLFRDVREGKDDTARANLLQDQRHWLQARLAACAIPTKGDLPADQQAAATKCLADQYAARIAALKPVPAQAAAAPPAPAAAPAAAPPAPTPAKPADAPVASSGSAKLDKTLFPAKGNNETLVTVAEFGRYSMTVKSDQGTALQYVDRMAGPSAIDGSAGHLDGRVDAFLDRGQYKIRLLSDPRGAGDAELSIVQSVELNPTELQLVELKPVTAELGDHEQRSYWLDIKERRFIAIEAAGRYLADLRLWKDGNWLVDAMPTAGERDPGGGEPLAFRQLATWLEPGLYRLTAYGGVGEKWSTGTTAKPFYLRYGIPALPDARRLVETASPFGIDRWLVPKSSNYFRIDIERPERAVLSVEDYAEEHPFATGGDRAQIQKDSRDPKAVIQTEGTDPKGFRLVTVERTPGAKYTLQYFDDTRQRRLDIDGPSASYWLATLQTGGAADALDPTAIVVRQDDKRSTVTAAATVEVGPNQGWRRKFNLLQPVSLFLKADQPTDLVVGGTGADAEYRIEPFLIDRADYKMPPSKTSGGTWRLDKGYWTLTVMPREGGKGILDMTLRPVNAVGDIAETPHLAAPVFPTVSFDKGRPYTLYLSSTGEGFGGAAVQKLPLDLGRGTAFQLAGGADLDIPFTVPKAGKLEAVTEDGAALALVIDGKAAEAGPMISDGKHKAHITAPGGKATYVSLIFTPEERLQNTPLPPVDKTVLAQRPKFPVLTPGKPAFLDLEKDESATYTLTVDKPALYRLESTGIIETSGAIRTRTVTSLDQQAANGIGRNFMIQQYLREGDYQLSATPSGASHGAIGLSAEATSVADLGALEPELWARATLSPGQAGRYRFHIADAGDYRLHTLGLHRDFAMRLDDGDGWPILTPGAEADITQHFEPGDYQMVLLPQPVASRAVTLLHRIEKPVELSGHGPFALTLGEAGSNRWMEPEKGTPRTPDTWKFTVPAEAEVTIAVDNGMRATLIENGMPTDKAAMTTSAWTGTLKAGDYAVEVVSAAPNSRVDYSLTVSTKEMVAGQARTVQAPSTLPISIGADKQIEIASFGGEDVKARLTDADGKLVAANDDRENDWNFLIPMRLAPGRYDLQVDPVGGKGASAEVSLTQPEEVQDTQIAFGKPATVKDGKVHVVPLPETQPDMLVLLTSHADTPVGLAIEGADADGAWHTLGSTSGRDPYLALPRGAIAKRALRVRVWSVDHGHIPINFAASAVSPATASESSLGRGLTLSALEGTDLGAAVVTLDQPGVLQLGAGGDTVEWASSGDTVAARDSSGSMVAPSTHLWLVDRLDRKHPRSITAHRVDPTGNDPVHLVVKGDETIMLPLPSGKESGVTLWRADGQGGQPGIALRDMGAAAARPPLMAAGAASPTLGSAVAMAAGPLAKPTVRIWSAGGTGDEMPVTLRHISFGAPKAGTLQPGITDGNLGSHEAQALALPQGVKRLTLVLPTDTVAVPMKGDTPEQMIWAVSSRSEIVETDADRLMLLHAAAETAPFSIIVEQAGAKPLTLAAGAITSRYTPTPGILHFAIDPAPMPETVLHIAGSAKAVTALNPDGTVRRGGDVKVAPGSLVSVEYQPGLLAVGLDAPKNAPSDKEATSVALPSAIPLTGTHMDLAINAGPQRLIHVTSDTPIIMRTNSSHEAAVTGVDSTVILNNASGRELFTAGADLNFVLAKDEWANLTVEPAGVAALSGMAHFTAIDLTQIGEGIGPKRRLAPGQSRAFRFTLTATRTIGVGVRASVDVATSRLLGEHGNEIGRGLVHMHELKAGNY
ncbi:MAG TPA: lysozyme inhibitor LprI family protein, partial [Alphaproteobacteria bacterium]|nr:lysozyme inhibitor LprI family protein [Alphaproteobacteria bacterium]